MIEYELRLSALSIKKYPVSPQNRNCVSKLKNIQFRRRCEYLKLHQELSMVEDKETLLTYWENNLEIIPE